MNWGRGAFLWSYFFFGLLSEISKPHSFFAEQEKTLKIFSHRFCWPSFDICYCFLSVLDVLLPFQSFRCAFLCSRRGKPHNFAKIHFFQIENKHYNLSNNTKKKERRHNCKNTKRNNMTFCVNSVRPFLKFKRYSDFYQTPFDYSSISLQYTFFCFISYCLKVSLGTLVDSTCISFFRPNFFRHETDFSSRHVKHKHAMFGNRKCHKKFYYKGYIGISYLHTRIRAPLAKWSFPEVANMYNGTQTRSDP